VRFCLTSFF